MDTLNSFKIEPSPLKMYPFYAALGVWIAAVVFLILAWTNANSPTNAEKQKQFNNFLAVTVLALIVGMYLTLAVCA